MKQCSQCGKVNPDDATICSYCGNNMTGANNPSGNGQQTGQNNQAGMGQQQPNSGNQQQFWQQYGQQYEQTYNPTFNAEEYYTRNNAFDSNALGKSRGITALLAILLGGFGVHYFYLGKVTAGLITILLCLVTCGLWSLLNFVQGIVLLCSDNYYFDRKFAYSNSPLPLF